MVNAQTVRVPLESYRVHGISQPLVRARVSLWIRMGLQQFREVPFVVDSAAGLTSMPVAKAAELGIPIPRKAVEFRLETATGPTRQLRHPGRIQGKIFGLEGWTFDWPCHFVDQQGPAPKAVLGLAGILDDLRIILDGTYALEAPFGWVILKCRR